MAGLKHWRFPRRIRPMFLLPLVCLMCYWYRPVFPIRLNEICDDELTRCAPLNCSDRLDPGDPPLASIWPYSRLNCRCDGLCALHGDCCVDYWEHCANSTHPPVTSSIYTGFFECIFPIREYLNPTGYVAVSRCPLEWTDERARNNCENNTLAKSEKMLTIFVTGPDDFVFKNVYCALCHGIPREAIKPWSLKMWNCFANESFDYPYYDTCESFEIRPPPSMNSDPHRCYSTYTDSCSSAGSTEDQTAITCGNHTSRVFYIDSDSGNMSAYKNVQCSNCSFQPSHRLLCIYTKSVFSFGQSFHLLFDFTKNTVVSNEERFSVLVDSPLTLGTDCSPFQIFDPFLNVCRNLLRPDGSSQCTESVAAFPNISRCEQWLHGTLSTHIDGDKAAVWVTAILNDSRADDVAIYIRANFSVSGQIQEALSEVIFDGVSMRSPCDDGTVLILVTSPEAATNESSPSPICDGFTMQDVDLNDIAFDGHSTFLVNASGYSYEGSAVMHVTAYEWNSTDGAFSSTRVFLRLCSPFTGNVCPVVVLNQSAFDVLDSGGDDVSFVYRASGQVFASEDVWQLPDRTIQVCDFLLRALDDVQPWVITLSHITVGLGGCSVVMLTLLLVTYAVFPPLRNRRGKIVMNLAVALMLAQAVLMVGELPVNWLCVLRGALLHFSWLAAFLWMGVFAGGLTRTIVSNKLPRNHHEESKDRYSVLKLAVLAWGVPASVVAANALLSTLWIGPSSWQWLEYGGRFCWIKNDFHSLLAFGLPISVILLFNCIMAAVSIVAVAKNRIGLNSVVVVARKVKMEVLLCLKITVITGVTWSLIVVANFADVGAIWYISAIVNSLQGALIGVVFLLKGDVLGSWREKLRSWRARFGDAEGSAAARGPSTRRTSASSAPDAKDGVRSDRSQRATVAAFAMTKGITGGEGEVPAERFSPE